MVALRAQTLLSKARCLLRAHMLTTYDPSVTHVIASAGVDRVTKRTIKYLQAIGGGHWIVCPACTQRSRKGDGRQ